MWRVLCVITAALCGCSANVCDDPDEVVAPSSSTAPGTVQRGLRQSDDVARSAASLAVRSDGTVICVTCASIATFDPSLRQLGRVAAQGRAGVVVTADDSIFAVRLGSEPGTIDIIALSPAGTIRWRSPVDSEAVDLFASDDNLYAVARLADANGQQRPRTVFAVDPATGALHTIATTFSPIGPAHRGILAVSAVPGPPGSLGIDQIDPAGNIAWSHIVRSFVGAFAGSAPIADGGVIVFGSTYSDVDLGDATITIPARDRENGFVAAFDATGATRWAFAVETGGVTHLAVAADAAPGVAVTADSRLFIASRTVSGSDLSPRIDSHLAVATPAGVTRSLTIDGDGDQKIIGLAAAVDGAAWIQLENTRSIGDFDDEPPLAHIGSLRFPAPGLYLFELVP
jgi:hypothetical protein